MTAPHRPDELKDSERRGHEPRDANIRNVLVFGGGTLVLVIMIGVVVSVIVYKSMGWVSGEVPNPPQFQATQQQLPPLPRLEVQGPRDLNELRQAEQKQLDSYGWVDTSRGVVRIPIGRAMELLAERGLGAGRRGNASGSPDSRSPAVSGNSAMGGASRAGIHRKTPKNTGGK